MLGPHDGQVPVREISAHASSAGALMNRLAMSVTPRPSEAAHGADQQERPPEGLMASM
jgi:hypothetical protein